jgi:DNA topoisomerase-1
VNEYLKAITGKDITAKDFRTWAGTVLAAMALSELESFDSAAQAKRNLRGAIEKVSARLGNTPTICRKCYIHPEVLNSYMDGNLVLEIKSQAESELRNAVVNMKPEEAAVLALLRGRLAKEAEQSASADPKLLSGKRRRSTTRGHVPCRRSKARNAPPATSPSGDA